MVASSSGASSSSLSQTSAACCAARSSTSANAGAGFPARASKDSSEQTPASLIPQGTMARKSSSRVLTLKANPCVVIQRDRCTPMAPSFSQPLAPAPLRTQTPVRPATRSASTPNERAVRNHQLLDAADVLAHVLAVRLQVQHRVADQLPGPVVGHVAAAIGRVQLESARLQLQGIP